MNKQVIFLLCICHCYFIIARYQQSGIAYLSATLGIEWCCFQHHLVLLLSFCLYFPVFDNLRFSLQVSITNEGCPARTIYFHPVFRIYSSSRTAAIFLLLH